MIRTFERERALDVVSLNAILTSEPSGWKVPVIASAGVITEGSYDMVITHL
jgi:hypothetical protein